MSETVVSETLEYEYNSGKLKPFLLWQRTAFWFKTILPKVITITNDEHILRIAKEAKYFIINGWELGINKTNNQKLNMNSHPDDWLGKEAETETATQLTEQLMQGKTTSLLQGDKIIIQHFCMPKNTDPRTGRTLKYRLIRACSHSERGEA